MTTSLFAPCLRTNNLTMASSASPSLSNFNGKYLHPGSHNTTRPRRKVLSMNKGFNQGLTNHFGASLVGGNKHHQLAAQEGTSVRTGFGLTCPRSGGKRGVVTMVIPFQRGSAWEQPPPDLPSYFFKERIVYLGMPLLPSVSELLHASFMYLAWDDPDKPIYMYINSTGITKDGYKLGYDSEAFAVHDHMQMVKKTTPIYTLCVGNAWGEAALLLAAGSYGYRAALPSTTIMIKEPVALKRGQATDLDLARKEVRYYKNTLVSMLARNTGHPTAKIEQDMRQPKYFSPEEAVEYGLIDKVLYVNKTKKDEVKPSRFLSTGGL
uniref:ATP-dependent Clp protease proteolytic subunit n=1 Tax=Wollemia nobilis TaxID=56998 RepID=A0A0C9QVF2_9CONI